METKQIPVKALMWLRFFITGACILSGWLTGGGIDRYIVQLPAWRHIDILTWAEFSRHADLGNGLFVYPFEGIGGLLLLIVSSFVLIIHRNNRILNSLSVPAYFATGFAVIGLILTLFAAPAMLSLRTIANDPTLLQNAFDRFYYWSLFRGIAQVLSFFGCIWAMARAFGTTNFINS